MATEEPKFESLRKEDNIEIRRYVPVIVAETTVDGDMDTASGRGFQLIAGYIFGNNERIAMTAPVVAEAQSSAEKIAMTVPVSIEPQNAEDSKMAGAQRWRIHFVMPSQYTLATLPKPLNPQVQLREIPGQNLCRIDLLWHQHGKHDAGKNRAIARLAQDAKNRNNRQTPTRPLQPALDPTVFAPQRDIAGN